MKLNYDCVRDVLLTCEKAPTLSPDLEFEYLWLKDFKNALPDYSVEDIVYTLILLDEAGYIDCLCIDSDTQIMNMRIHRLTYTGHEFLETIRPEKLWKKTLGILSKVGSVTLPLISDTATNLLTSAITDLLSQ